MFEIFKEIPDTNYSRTTKSNSEYIFDRLTNETNRVIEYYNNKVSSIDNRHILIRLLRTLSAPLELDLYEYRRIIDTKSMYVCKSLGIGTPLNQSENHTGMFYPVDDVLITTIEIDYDIDTLADNWKNLSPVRVLYHPYNGLQPTFVDNRYFPYKKGFAVICVDPVLLKLIHRLWLQEQYSKTSEDGTMLTDNHFVHMVIIPAMITSHLEIALMNRYMDLYNNNLLDTGYVKAPIVLNNYENKVDTIALEYLLDLIDSSYSYIRYLYQLPSIYGKTMLEAMILPTFTSTRQNFKYFFLSRLYVIDWLIDIGGDNGCRFNRDLISRLRIQIKRLSRDRSLMTTLDTYNYNRIRNVIDKLKKIKAK